MINLTSHDAAAPLSAQRWPARRIAVAVGVVSTGAAALLMTRSVWLPLTQPAIDFAEGNAILVADIENLTGEEIFDASLDAALTVALMQSKHLNVFPRQRMSSLLRRIGKPAEVVVDVAQACDLAKREGLRMVVAGRIERRGTGYRLTASLVEPATSRELSSQTAFVPGREQVLDAVDSLARGLRRRLGEAVAPSSEQSLPLAQATTSSLPALKLYARSLRVRAGDEKQGDEWLRQAITLDADFALALGALAWRLYQFGDHERRAEGDRLFARAQALPHRLTLREQLWLVPRTDDARGKREEAVAGYRAFLAHYPKDSAAWFRLGWTYMAGLGRPELAAEVFRRLTQIDPGYAGAWINLATCLNGMRQYDEAIATYHRAFALAPDFQTALHVNAEYGGALVHLGRLDEARDVFAKMQAAPDPVFQARGRRSMAFLRMHQGRYREAIAELGEAIRLNSAGHEPLSLLRDHALRAAAHLSLGAKAETQRELATVNSWIARLALAPEWLTRVVKLQARRGDVAEVRRLVALMQATLGNAQADASISRNLSSDNGYLDLARSELELLGGHAERAIAHADAAAQRLPAEAVLAVWARALLRGGHLEDAAAKYRQLIDGAPFGYEEQEEVAAAMVALASIHELLGRRAQARALYDSLVQRWREGDAELPLLKLARTRARLMAL